MRPAISAAGTSDGASRNASLARVSALSGLAASASRASAVSSTARRRSATLGFDMAVLPGDGQRVERALVVAGAGLHVEQRVDAPGELADRASPPARRERGPRRCRCCALASRNRPRTPSSCVSGRSSMASKARRAASRSPLSWAACARATPSTARAADCGRRCRHSAAPARGRRRRWRAVRATARHSLAAAAARATWAAIAAGRVNR